MDSFIIPSMSSFLNPSGATDLATTSGKNCRRLWEYPQCKGLREAIDEIAALPGISDDEKYDSDFTAGGKQFWCLLITLSFVFFFLK